MNKDRYVLQVFFDNQQAAIVAGEMVSKNLGIVVDILHHREITTIHPPLLPFGGEDSQSADSGQAVKGFEETIKLENKDG